MQRLISRVRVYGEKSGYPKYDRAVADIPRVDDLSMLTALSSLIPDSEKPDISRRKEYIHRRRHFVL